MIRVPTTHANGLDLYYEEHGHGPPILCIHGTSSSALVWERDVHEIAKHGRVITYDRRGCFRSERPKPYDTTTVADHTDDAAALLDALDATPAFIIARSCLNFQRYSCLDPIQKKGGTINSSV